MRDVFTELAEEAVRRYSSFLDVLRSQADLAVRRGAISEIVRNEAIAVAQRSARSFLSAEQAQINADTQIVAQRAHERALSDLEMPRSSIADRFADFIFSAAHYTSRILAAQVERDTTAMAQYLRTLAQRIDLYVRSGRFTETTAVSMVMQEDASSPEFRYIDRLGRRYKSTKHIRDIYRQHLINVSNEVYIDVLADHGVDRVTITHPDPNYKWNGVVVAIVGGIKGLPLYYDVRDEVFHPGSNATLALHALENA